MKKIYVPSSSMRTNDLSKMDGGSTVIFKYEGYDVVYTNIKNPSSYITASLKKMFDKKPTSILVDGEIYLQN